MTPDLMFSELARRFLDLDRRACAGELTPSEIRAELQRLSLLSAAARLLLGLHSRRPRLTTGCATGTPSSSQRWTRRRSTSARQTAQGFSMGNGTGSVIAGTSTSKMGPRASFRQPAD